MPDALDTSFSPFYPWPSAGWSSQCSHDSCWHHSCCGRPSWEKSCRSSRKDPDYDLFPFPFLYFLPLYFDTGFPVVQASLKLIMYNWRWLWVLLPLLFLGGKQSCLFYFCIIFFTQAQRLGKRWFNRKGNCSSFQVFTCICTMCACACIYMVPVCNQVNECACRDQRLMSDVFLYHCPLYLLRWRLTESGTHGSTNLK